MTRSPQSYAGRIGAYVRWGRTPDRTAATEPARRAAAGRFLKEVLAEFPDVDQETAEKMAVSRQRAHMARIARLPRRKAG